MSRRPQRRMDAEPFAGADRTGMPTDLLAAENRARWSLSPRRNRWAELAAYDARVGELEERQRAVRADLERLREQLRTAPADDADRLATWQLAGEKGKRPEPTADRLATSIEERRAVLEGLRRATDRVLAEKAEHVERHRGRLVKDADQAVHDSHARLVALLDQVADARDDLADARRTAAWAALFPDAAAAQEPNYGALAGGLRDPVRNTLGLDVQLSAARVLEALRQDADWLTSAATPAQRAVLAGRDPDRPVSGAVWANTEEARQHERAEKAAALERYRREWGVDPA